MFCTQIYTRRNGTFSWKSGTSRPVEFVIFFCRCSNSNRNRFCFCRDIVPPWTEKKEAPTRVPKKIRESLNFIYEFAAERSSNVNIFLSVYFHRLRLRGNRFVFTGFKRRHAQVGRQVARSVRFKFSMSPRTERTFLCVFVWGRDNDIIIISRRAG